MSDMQKNLTKQKAELEAKGAMRTKHENRELANIDVKLETLALHYKRKAS